MEETLRLNMEKITFWNLCWASNIQAKSFETPTFQ